MKNKYLLTLIILASFFIANNQSSNTAKIDRKSTFLDSVKSEDPEAQNALNKLKEDFYNDRERINEKYERKIKELKKSRRNEIKNLKDKYKNRMKRLKKKYPQIPDINVDSKPKPKLKPPVSDKKTKLREGKKKEKAEKLKKDLKRKEKVK